MPRHRPGGHLPARPSYLLLLLVLLLVLLLALTASLVHALFMLVFMKRATAAPQNTFHGKRRKKKERNPLPWYVVR